MKDMVTWIYALVVTSFYRLNGTEYACALDGADVQLFADYDEACWQKTRLQDGFYKEGYHIVGSDYQSGGEGVCYWTRIEKSDGTAHVLAIYRKSVVGDLFQVRRG